jgi:hypothetical protein
LRNGSEATDGLRCPATVSSRGTHHHEPLRHPPGAPLFAPRDDEARECFKLFDKRDKGYITMNDLKSVLPNYLEFPVTDNELQELISECDPNSTGNIREKEFMKLYTQ